MYEDYMQNLLGVNFSPYSNSQFYNQMDNCMCNQNDNWSMNNDSELEDCYPEIYKIIYPMVEKACRQNTKPINRDLVDELTNDIYSHIEAQNVINLNISVDNNNREDRQSNPIQDLIRILLIRELLRRRRNNRPPVLFPPRPFPPRPGMPGNPPPRPMPPRR